MKSSLLLSLVFISGAAFAAPLTVSPQEIQDKTNLVAVANHAVKGVATDILVDDKGLTLYTFDQDSTNTSTCSGGCLTVWPPQHVPADATVLPPYGMIMGNDGQNQLTIKGLPLYHHRNDKNPGDTNGEYGTWHVVTVR